MEMKAAAAAAIHAKSLKLDCRSRIRYGTGDVVNLVSTDAATIQVIIKRLTLSTKILRCNLQCTRARHRRSCPN